MIQTAGLVSLKDARNAHESLGSNGLEEWSEGIWCDQTLESLSLSLMCEHDL